MMFNRVMNFETACDLAAQAGVIMFTSSGAPALVVTGLVIRCAACTVLGRMLEAGIEKLREAAHVENPTLAKALQIVGLIANLTLRAWLFSKLFPSGETAIGRCVERVRAKDIVEDGITKVVYEYRPKQWTIDVREWAAIVQIAGLCGLGAAEWLKAKMDELRESAEVLYRQVWNYFAPREAQAV